MDKLEYVNNKIRTNGNYSVGVPLVLYKYRPFDEYTFDMIDKKYLFLCKVANLDDKTECHIHMDINDLYNVVNNNLEPQCVIKILEKIQPYTSQQSYLYARDSIVRLMDTKGHIQPRFLLEWCQDIQDIITEVDVAPIVNYINEIPTRLKMPEYEHLLRKVILDAIDAKECMGVCSLSECCDSEYMWNNYADHKTGYCIEYNISGYNNDMLLPVFYTDDRKYGLIDQILEEFINTMIEGFSQGNIKTDRSQYIRLFLTKNTEWEYQKEWRIIGDADTKINAPTIAKIILGQDVTYKNRFKMKKICDKYGIELLN